MLIGFHPCLLISQILVYLYLMSQKLFGKRLQAYRKAAGFRSVDAFLEALPPGFISASVLRTIEAGRDREFTVRELLVLADALKISPLYLLVDVLHPEDPLDIITGANKSGLEFLAEFDADQRNGSEKPRSDLEYHLVAIHSTLKAITDGERDLEVLRSLLKRNPSESQARALAYALSRHFLALRAYSQEPGVSEVWEERSDKAWREFLDTATKYGLDIPNHFHVIDLELVELGQSVSKEVKRRQELHVERWAAQANSKEGI